MQNVYDHRAIHRDPRWRLTGQTQEGALCSKTVHTSRGSASREGEGTPGRQFTGADGIVGLHSLTKFCTSSPSNDMAGPQSIRERELLSSDNGGLENRFTSDHVVELDGGCELGLWNPQAWA